MFWSGHPRGRVLPGSARAAFGAEKALAIWFILTSCHALAHSSEESDRAGRALAAEGFIVTLADPGWSFQRTSKAGEGPKDRTYHYSDKEKKCLLMITVLDHGHMPSNEHAAVGFVEGFVRKGHDGKGWRFVPLASNALLIEEAVTSLDEVTGISTHLFLQGEGEEVYCVTGLIVGVESDLADRLKIIRQVSFSGAVLSEEMINRPFKQVEIEGLPEGLSIDHKDLLGGKRYASFDVAFITSKIQEFGYRDARVEYLDGKIIASPGSRYTITRIIMSEERESLFFDCEMPMTKKNLLMFEELFSSCRMDMHMDPEANTAYLKFIMLPGAEAVSP